MIDIEAVCVMIGDLQAQEVERWIGESWVRPESSGGGYVFHEIDVARVRLIVELRRDLEIDDAAMPVVLNLLDQLYALRRRMKAVTAAIETLPPDLRAAIAQRLGETQGPE
ncbi:MAG TPA: chaperone modulator CbpM [Stellaceae bacterium]|nr:chaperone modulator CbpM [Stellaceae bacterium]